MNPTRYSVVFPGCSELSASSLAGQFDGGACVVQSLRDQERQPCDGNSWKEQMSFGADNTPCARDPAIMVIVYCLGALLERFLISTGLTRNCITPADVVLSNGHGFRIPVLLTEISPRVAASPCVGPSVRARPRQCPSTDRVAHAANRVRSFP